MEQRISVVTLGVDALARARAFYTSWGWTPVPDEHDDVVFFQAGAMVLALWGRQLLADDSCVENTPGWGGITLAHNVRSRAEVDAIVEQGRVAGGTVGREPAETFYGGYSGIVIDPEGHPWEISHNPGWTIEADGAITIG